MKIINLGQLEVFPMQIPLTANSFGSLTIQEYIPGTIIAILMDESNGIPG